MVYNTENNVEIQNVFRNFRRYIKEDLRLRGASPLCLFLHVDDRKVELVVELGEQGMDLHLAGEENLASAV